MSRYLISGFPTMCVGIANALLSVNATTESFMKYLRFVSDIRLIKDSRSGDIVGMQKKIITLKDLEYYEESEWEDCDIEDEFTKGK